MSTIIRYKTLLSVLVIITALGCGNSDSGTQNISENFDRNVFLTNMIDNLIIPNFSELNQKVVNLDQAIISFTESPNLNTLQTCKNQFHEAYLSWQYCNSFNFGPNELQIYGSLSENLAVFPINVEKVEIKIKNADLGFENFDRDTRGFLALDYLLYSSKKEDIVKAFEGLNRKNYLKKVSSDIKQKINTVSQAWPAYRTSYLANNGTDAGSSTSMLYNEFVKSYEALKNFKVLLPAGKRAGQVSPESDKVEAFYSGQSVAYIKAHFESIQNIWEGRAKKGNDGIGFQEYLKAVNGGEALITSTLEQQKKTKSSIGILPTSPLSETIKTNNEIVSLTGVELQKLTRFYKSDLSSLLGIAITFSSGDGD